MRSVKTRSTLLFLFCTLGACNLFAPIDGDGETGADSGPTDGGGDVRPDDMDRGMTDAADDAGTDAADDVAVDARGIDADDVDLPDLPDMPPDMPAVDCYEFAAASRVAHWTFDTPTGDRYLDESPGGAGGTLRHVEGEPSPIDGVVGSAAFFDGDDALASDHVPALELAEGTFSLWIRIDELPGPGTFVGILSKDADGNRDGGHAQLFVDGGDLTFRLQSVDEDHELVFPDVPANQWMHVVTTFGPGGMSMYVGGSAVDTDGYSGGMHDGSSGNEEPLAIGASSGFSNPNDYEPLDRFFTGAVDDLIVFDRALSDGDVRELYAACRDGFSE